MRKVKSIQASRITTNTITRVLLILYLLTIIVPFIFMLMNSLKTNQEFYSSIWSLPANFLIENYARGLEIANIPQLFTNTIYIVFAASLINIMAASLLAYAISRTGFKFSDAVYKYLLIGLLTPGIVCIIPVFFVIRILGLYNTQPGLILVYASFNMAFSVFVMYSFFKTLPRDLEDAAFIDGATYFQTYWRVMFPLTKPGLITIGVFGFLEYWNDYLLAMTLIIDEPLKTVSLGVMKMQAANNVRTDWGPLFAVCIMAMIPVLLVYSLFQGKLTAGLTAGAIKG